MLWVFSFEPSLYREFHKYISLPVIPVCNDLRHNSCFYGGCGSSVGTATRYSLDDLGFELRWVWDFLLSTPVQTGPRAHLTSCTVGAGDLYWVVKWSGRSVDQPPYLLLRFRISGAIPLLPVFSLMASYVEISIFDIRRIFGSSNGVWRDAVQFCTDSTANSGQRHMGTITFRQRTASEIKPNVSPCCLINTCK
jgi:hypothetical protein